MMIAQAQAEFPGEHPDWIPLNIRNYLIHTVRGVSIRELARRQGVHASTIMRQVHRVEARRDDPLLDTALNRLAQDGRAEEELASLLAQDGLRVLRRLCETGAMMAVGEGMENAIVMRTDSGVDGTRTAVVAMSLAQAMALCDWVSCSTPGRISRYRATAAGRAALSHLMAAAENRARTDMGAGDAGRGAGREIGPKRDSDAEPGQALGRVWGSSDPATDVLQKFAESGAAFLHAPARTGGAASRYKAVESPLVALARRRDRDGSRFLGRDLVRAGERLREDFEVAQLSGPVEDDWGTILADQEVGNPASCGARLRVMDALRALGPGLGDVALRCCCHLEGLEQTEKRMGWSARSGKIVLRIALQQLCRHYETTRDTGADMIG